MDCKIVTAKEAYTEIIKKNCRCTDYMLFHFKLCSWCTDNGIPLYELYAKALKHEESDISKKTFPLKLI